MNWSRPSFPLLRVHASLIMAEVRVRCLTSKGLSAFLVALVQTCSVSSRPDHHRLVTIPEAAVKPLDPELENIVSDKKKMGSAFALAQRLGRSLMLPIATLPAAGLLLRLGQADMLGADGLAKNLSWLQPVADIFAAAGGAVFDNLPLIFAVGVAVGFAKKADGSTGVAGLFGFLVYRAVTWAMSPIVMGKPAPLTQDALDCLHAFDPAKGKITQVGPWNQGTELSRWCRPKGMSSRLTVPKTKTARAPAMPLEFPALMSQPPSWSLMSQLKAG